MGWNYEKNTRWEKNDELFADSVFDGDLVGLRKNGWILAIRRKSKAKRPHMPENKEEGSRRDTSHKEVSLAAFISICNDGWI